MVVLFRYDPCQRNLSCRHSPSGDPQESFPIPIIRHWKLLPLPHPSLPPDSTHQPQQVILSRVPTPIILEKPFRRPLRAQKHSRQPRPIDVMRIRLDRYAGCLDAREPEAERRLPVFLRCNSEVDPGCGVAEGAAGDAGLQGVGEAAEGYVRCGGEGVLFRECYLKSVLLERNLCQCLCWDAYESVSVYAIVCEALGAHA